MIFVNKIYSQSLLFWATCIVASYTNNTLSGTCWIGHARKFLKTVIFRSFVIDLFLNVSNRYCKPKHFICYWSADHLLLHDLFQTLGSLPKGDSGKKRSWHNQVLPGWEYLPGFTQYTIVYTWANCHTYTWYKPDGADLVVDSYSQVSSQGQGTCLSLFFVHFSFIHELIVIHTLGTSLMEEIWLLTPCQLLKSWYLPGCKQYTFRS